MEKAASKTVKKAEFALTPADLGYGSWDEAFSAYRKKVVPDKVESLDTRQPHRSIKKSN